MGPTLQRRVEGSTRRIGTVSVHHGETGCVTPEVAPYVERTLARRARRARRAAKTTA